MNPKERVLNILVDWEQFAFTPKRNDIELFVDGDVKLVSMELH